MDSKTGELYASMERAKAAGVKHPVEVRGREADLQRMSRVIKAEYDQKQKAKAKRRAKNKAGKQTPEGEPLMPAQKYKEKQPRVEAMKFKGGEESAREVIQWLRTYGRRIPKIDWVAELTEPAIIGDGRNVIQVEELVIWDHMGSGDRSSHCRKGQWIVMENGKAVEVLFSDEFNQKYEKD